MPDPAPGTLRPVPPPSRGSGPAACCGGHRERCLSGLMHTWSVWYEDGKLQRTPSTFRCEGCDGICTAEEDTPRGKRLAHVYFAPYDEFGPPPPGDRLELEAPRYPVLIRAVGYQDGQDHFIAGDDRIVIYYEPVSLACG